MLHAFLHRDAQILMEWDEPVTPSGLLEVGALNRRKLSWNQLRENRLLAQSFYE
jgi:hypothetical protein